MKFYLFFISLLFRSSLCDLPVHCLSSQIAGTWKLFFDPPTALSRPSCGHSTPDRNTDHLTAKMPVLPLQKSVLLKLPNLAYFSEDEEGFNKKVVSFLEDGGNLSYNENSSYKGDSSQNKGENQQTKEKISLLEANYKYYLNSKSIFDLDKVQILQNESQDSGSPQKSSEIKSKGGQWTMVYDEGFEIQIADYNFFAFSKYAKKFGKAAKDGDDSEIEGYESICGRTWLGWVKKKNKWGCFYGEKEDGEGRRENKEVFEGSEGEKIVEREDLIKKKEQINLSKKTNNFNSESELPTISQAIGSDDATSNSNGKLGFKVGDSENIAIISDENYKEKVNHTGDNEIKKEKKGRLRGGNGPLPTEKKYLNDYDMYIFHEIPHAELLKKPADDKKFVPDHRFIEQVNARENSLWKAKYHPEIMENSSLRDMQQMLGLTHHYFEKNKVKPSYTSSFLETSTASSTYSTHSSPSSSSSSASSSSSSSSLPSSFSWANIDTPIKRQGSCGSCYALATLAALEVRIRIKSSSISSSSSSSLLPPSSAQPFLSPSSAVYCSQYNQGCDGGYPYLTAKEGTEKGFFEESCQPTPGDCKSECFKGKTWKVNKK